MRSNFLTANLSPKMLFVIIAWLLLTGSLNASSGQNTFFEKSGSKFSSSKLMSETDSARTKKEDVKKKVNMKIPLYGGLIAGGVLSLVCFLSAIKDEKSDQSGESWEIHISPGPSAILGFIIGFPLGYWFTGVAILPFIGPKEIKKESDETNKFQNYVNTKKQFQPNGGVKKLTFFRYTYHF